METSVEKKSFVFGSIDRDFAPNIEDTRTVRFVISTAAKDRHATVLNMDNWQLDNFNNNPVIGYQHNVYGDNMCVPPNPDDVLGSGRSWIEDMNGKRVLMGEVKFDSKEINPLAEKVFRKILSGSLRATSVGFLEKGKGKYGTGDQARGMSNETYYYDGQELLEFSIVNIPSNPEATKRSLRNHTNAALSYISGLLPEFSANDIRKMSVQQILDTIEKRSTIEDEGDAKKRIEEHQSINQYIHDKTNFVKWKS